MTRGSVSLSCATTPHLYWFSKSYVMFLWGSVKMNFLFEFNFQVIIFKIVVQVHFKCVSESESTYFH